MLIRRLPFLLLLIGLSFVCGLAQNPPEPTPLVPGQPVERQIEGGQSHNYQITLQAGQFARVVVEQKAIDVALVLAAPDGKKVLEVNLTAAGGLESLSAEATANGDYRLTVRATGAVTLAGSYQLQLEVKAAATSQDRQRIAAERLMLEANELRRQGAKTAEQAIDKLQQALSLWRELGDQYSAAWSLASIGIANYNLSRNEKAIEYYEQALTLYREVKNRAGEGTTLGSLGSAYSNLRRYEKAIEYNGQALVIHREVKNRSSEGVTLNNLGLAYAGLSRYDKAIEYYGQALAISREVKNRIGEGGTLNSLGLAHYNLSRHDKAIEYYEQALPIHREVKNRTSEGNALRGLGLAYYGLNRHDESVEYYEQALAIFREVKNRTEEGSTLNSLGIAHYNLSRHDKTIEYYEQALAIHREVKNRTSEGNALRGLGLAYYGLSRHDKSIEYYEQALAIHREVKNRTSEAATLMSLGIAYADLGRPEKAIEYYEQVLQFYREVNERSSEGRALGNLGNAYRNLGRYEKALEYYGQILGIWREVKNRVEEGVTLGNLGLANSGLTRYEKALEYYEQALAIAREVKNRVNEGIMLDSFGDAYYKLGRHEKALEYYEQALAIHREVKSQSGEQDALYGLARADRAQGNLPSARTHIEEALKISESMRSDILSPESRASFLANVQSSYQLYTDVLMRLHQAEPAKGFDALAVEVSERQRARSLLDLLAEAGADVRQGVDAALVDRERTLAKQLNDKAQQLAQATRPEQSVTLRQEISRLETDLERAQVAIRKANPRYAALAQPQPLKLNEIQRQLDADTLLLEYALGEDRSYLWAITKDSLTSYELPKGVHIKQSALQVYELLTARSVNKRLESAQQRQERITQAEAKLPAAVQELSQTILAPVAAQLGNRRLVIVADGALQYIPFAMLPEPGSLDFGLGSSSNPVAQAVTAKPKGQRPKTEDQPLIVNHEVVSLPSASALAIQRADLAGRQLAPKMLAVIADPVFDRSDSRFTTPATDTGDLTQKQLITADDARSIEHLADKSNDKSGVTTLRLIPRLPFTRQEATRVLALAPKNSSFGAIDFQANRATVLNGDLGQYRYVHFATHGVLDSERPGLSSLLLSMVDAQGKPVDGFLRANDIYNLKLPAELVVLSACQTGLGKEIKGEGLVGLTRGFMYAGAARVVVSLWNVNDKATADLMTKFYEKMLKQGERPAAALRSAQVEMWRQKQWQSPYYWAAFTMQGEWR